MGSTMLTRAQDATWIGTAGPPLNWNDAANWAPTPAGPPPFVPTGTAFFNSSMLTATTIDIGSGTTVGGMNFTNSPGYTFTLSGSFIVNGAGVVVDGGSAAPIFTVNGQLVFAGSATAGRSVIDVNNSLLFAQTSNAGSALITNDGAINFQDGSSGGNATIINNANRFINFNAGGGPLSATAGNAIIDNSGTIVFQNSSTAGSSSITTKAGGNVFFANQSNAGSSNLTVQLNGAMNFQDSSSAGNSTIDNSGSVNFNNTSSAGAAHITNNTGGFLFFSQPTGSSSAGNATIENYGILAFGGTSTAANSTIITQPGGQTFFNGQSTGGTASLVINANAISGGTVSIAGIVDPSFTIGSLAGTRVGFGPPFGQFQIDSKNLIVGGNNQSTSYMGVIFDNGQGGSLTKVGTGTQTLGGFATYLGGTSIQSGGLDITGTLNTGSILVGPSGTLSGNGFITVNSGTGTTTVNGTLAPTSGGLAPMQLMSNLNLNPGATYLATVGNGALGFAAVTGNVTLGGELKVQLGGTGMNFGTAYMALTSTQLLNQQFDTTSAPGALAMQVTYNPTNVMVSFAPDFLNYAAPGSENQRAVAGAIQTGLAAAPNAGAFQPLIGLQQGQYLAALSQLSGEVSTGASTNSLQAAGSFLGVMLNSTLAANAASGTGGALGFGRADTSEESVADAYASKKKPSPAGTDAFAQLRRGPARDPADRYNSWASGYGGWAKNDGNATVGSSTIDSRFGGLAAGIDVRPNADAVMGIAVGGAIGSYGLGNNLGSGDVNMFQIGGYGALKNGSTYIAGALAYGFHSVTTSRTTSVAPGDKITGGFDAHSFNARVEMGNRFGGTGVGVTPFAALQGQSFLAPSYQERAAGAAAPFALAFASESTSQVRSELGVGFDVKAPTNAVSLKGRVAWAHQFADAPTATAAFTALPTIPFTVTGAQLGRDALLASAAAEWRLDPSRLVFARFDTEQSGTGQSYGGQGGFRWTW